MARFERSTLREHKGTRTIVLRFLKMITPVKCVIPLYDGYVLSSPKEGELFHRRSGRTLGLGNTVWSVNINNTRNARGFQLLWDTST